MSWSEWLIMGGYARFVWPAYVIALVILAWNLCAPIRRHRRFIRDLSQQRK